MCGLVGIAGNISVKANKVFQNLLLFDAVRGMDATGVAVVPIIAARDPLISKKWGTPENLFLYDEYNLFDYRGVIKAVCNKVLLGHNRAATIGSTSDENAHPFNVGNIYGAHNGSLRCYNKLKGFKEHEVDSKCIFDHINTHGIKSCWESFTGAAALTWWNTEEQSLYMIRNDERPLSYIYDEAKKTILWASEPSMIFIAAQRNGLALNKDKKGKYVTETLKPEHLYKFKVNALEAILEGVEELEPMSFTTGVPKTTVIGGGTPKNKGTGERLGGTTKYRISTKEKRINDGWAKGMLKGDKDTRGLKIEILYRTSSRFVCKFYENNPKGLFKYPSHTVNIWPHSRQAFEQLTKAFNSTNLHFKVNSRMRYKEDPTLEVMSWGISSAAISPTIVPKKNVIGFPKVTQEKKIPTSLGLCKTYGGVYIPKLEWLNDFERQASRCSCIWCGDPLDVEDHEKFVYISRGEAFCEYCTSTDSRKSEILNVFPHIKLEA